MWCCLAFLDLVQPRRRYRRQVLQIHPSCNSNLLKAPWLVVAPFRNVGAVIEVFPDPHTNWQYLELKIPVFLTLTLKATLVIFRTGKNGYLKSNAARCMSFQDVLCVPTFL